MLLVSFILVDEFSRSLELKLGPEDTIISINLVSLREL